MNHLTADDSLLERLRGIVESVEIRDPNGMVLGHYTPLLAPEEKEAYARVAELFDLEEVKRIAATERHGSNLAEVMDHLRSLEKKCRDGP